MAEFDTLFGRNSDAVHPAFDLQARTVIRFHELFLAGDADAGTARNRATGLWRWVAENHACNTALWKEEDKARRTDVADAEIVRCKRNIDGYNQRRNDAVEALDDCILSAFEPGPAQAEARLSSETAGAMIDRLSILALKIHHMGFQAGRAEAGEAHMQRCRERLVVLREQRNDLAACLDRLLWEARCGAARFKTYRQFKM